MKTQKYISLKEAAKISGYAPDYIGQLIRKGSLPGKQVYYNVAWMTTEEAVRSYVREIREGRGTYSLQEKGVRVFRRLKLRLFSEAQLVTIVRAVLYLVIVLSVGFFLILFYIFSTSVDKELHQNALKHFDEQQQ
jgi:hypothetical protein